MADFQPVHVVVDRLVQVTTGRRNRKDGDMDVIETLAPSVNTIGIPGGSAAGSFNPRYADRKKLAAQVWLHLLTAPAGAQAEFTKPDTAGVRILIPEVKRSGDLPQPCEGLMVEAAIYWPDRRGRDRNNYVALLDKWLGDALQLATIIENDDWTRYAFGNLERGYGPARIEVTFFPREDRIPYLEESSPAAAEAALF